MPPMQSGFGNLMPPTPGKKALLGMAGALVVLLACFALAFMAFPSEGAPTTTTPAATTQADAIATIVAATLSVMATQPITPTVTPIVPATGVTNTVAANATPSVAPTQPCTFVKGTIFNDANVNQIRDNEAGISGASVQLQTQAGAVASSATSDSAGAFELSNIPFGSYRVVVAPPSGFVPTTPNQLPLNLLGCGGMSDLNFGFAPMPPTANPAAANPPTQAPVAANPTAAPTSAPPTPIVIVVTVIPTQVPPTQAIPTNAPPPTTDVPPPPTVAPTPTPTATPEFYITDATAKLTATDCPSVYFDGTITASGQGTAVYQWELENGITTPPQTLTFFASGSQAVPLYERDIEGGLLGTSGWVRLKVLQPNALTSEPAVFQFTCNAPVE